MNKSLHKNNITLVALSFAEILKNDLRFFSSQTKWLFTLPPQILNGFLLPMFSTLVAVYSIQTIFYITLIFRPALL